MTGSSRSSMLTSPCRSDAEAEAQPSPAANLLAEQVSTQSVSIHPPILMQPMEFNLCSPVMQPGLSELSYLDSYVP